ncbi:DUF4440 domain-containing protein [Streptomyces sp. NPDC041068]|uniref:nuclear transport factor 2 family protein n=1 Tax=Streptomyces sp. NPDC041068 TaxID=3155130 RepID=UPI0033C01708
MSKAEIDTLTAEFLGSLDNRGGRAADVGRIRRLMVPGGLLVVTGPKYTAYTVEEFIGPREELLSSGRVVEFHEWEISERTEIVGDIATRFGEYGKSGIANGEPFEGRGAQTFQFVRTPEGWRIAAFSWYDHD